MRGKPPPFRAGKDGADGVAVLAVDGGGLYKISSMQRLQAYKYELMPTSEQQRDMRRFAGSCRFVFNKALALQKEHYEQGKKKLGYAGLCKLLTEWRNGSETPWLADAPTHPLQQTLKDLERAYTNFFAKRADFPRFKKKGQSDSFKQHETALRRAQQAMSRKTKFSSNWKKAKARVQRIHARIGNARCNYLHKCSTTISQNHAMVCLEDLQVRNMSRSAAGTTETPGKNVRAKSGLNKTILDQGWAEFRRQLDYKLAWNGEHLIAVPAQNTSRTCPCCGHVSADNRQTQARFQCVECGFKENADLVGAINILSRGMQRLRDEGQDTADASAGRETAARIACEVSGAVMPPAAGTRRSDSCRLDAGMSAVGIPRL